MAEALHQLHATLLELGICAPGSLEPFAERVRDRPDIEVHRCNRSGVVVLGSIDHADLGYYEAKEHAELAQLGDVERVARSHETDTARRAASVGHLVTNRDWLDVGTGSGAIIDRIGPWATSVQAVEPQGEFRALLRERGFQVYAEIAAVPDGSIDIATLFHVFEHIPDPLDFLKTLRHKLRPGGRAVIEVPHARDLLLDFLEVPDFKSFTLWSEHLMLHTRDSLRTMLGAAGFSDIVVTGLQRYPVANHLHWLARGRPGGHHSWSFLTDEGLDRNYEAVLARMDATDTLVAEASIV